MDLWVGFLVWVVGFVCGALLATAVAAACPESQSSPEPPPLQVSVWLHNEYAVPAIGDDFCHRDYWFKVTKIGPHMGSGRYIQIVRDPDPVPEKEPRPVQSEMPVCRPNGIVKWPQA